MSPGFNSSEARSPFARGLWQRHRQYHHLSTKQRHCVSTLRTYAVMITVMDVTAAQTEIVLKILKPSRAVLMTAPGI